MTRLRQPLARLVLLSLLPLAACASVAPVPVVVPLDLPASLLACQPEPEPPADNANDAAFGDYLVSLSDAGADCRDKLAAVASVVDGRK